ncbi:fruiting body protein SC7-like [Haliotis rufescens]|uniref:fruiting body protein SC7-like n=1 Tax=Haliotis rufescens TaxID=6454 RepID=UPI00201F5772|nr:fruiting body protein SC7-like [Haliotis rufescens]
MKIYVAVVVIVLVNVAGVGAVGDGKLVQEDKDYLVKGHNDERKNQGASNMYKLKWDDGLADTAQKHADKCLWEHTPDGERQWGENMAQLRFPEAKYLDLYSHSKMIDILVTEGMTGFTSWNGEEVIDVKRDFSCAKKGWTGETCGHYTQVAWHSSTKIGCGAKNCLDFTQNKDPEEIQHNVWILVCAYLKPGNLEGEDAFKKGKACSACEGSDKCEDGLCVAS